MTHKINSWGFPQFSNKMLQTTLKKFLSIITYNIGYFITISFLFFRSGSITEDGITTRFREESREGSLRRDSLSRDSIRENSILESSKRERDSSLTRSDGGGRDRYTQLSVIESVADLRNKYSPANYIPAVYRKKENISRSKSINDIGLPPIERTDSKSVNSKKKVKDGGVSYNNSLGLTEFSNNTNNDNMYITEDDNGNRQPVSEIRKRFENNTTWKDKIKKEENDIVKRPLKLSKLEKDDNGDCIDDVSMKQKGEEDGLNNKFDGCGSVSGDISKNATLNGLEASNRSKSTVSDRQDKLKNGIEIGGSNQLNNHEDNSGTSVESAESKTNGESRRSRVNNFSSYIPAKDYEKGDIVNGIDRLDNAADLLNNDNRNDMNNLNKSRLYQDKTNNVSTLLVFFLSFF